MTKKALFLYTELAEYFLVCAKTLADKGVEVHIIKWPVNQEAPFDFVFPENVSFYDKQDFSFSELEQLINKISPDVMYCSGWVDKEYLKICRKWKKRIPVLLGLDNQWKGTVRQHLAGFLSPIMVINSFSHAWVPGKRQYKFARKLGFKKDKIFTGFYTCDYDKFNQFYLDNKEQKQQEFPKRFIYVGRYYSFKGVNELWQAFTEMQEDIPNQWELWCLGKGDVAPFKHPQIKHFGFVQPKDMNLYFSQTGVFVLPSQKEPWGVVVHEFAAAGYPLICTDEVGAADDFLTHESNGYLAEANNVYSLRRAMERMVIKTDKELLKMGEISAEKAKQITPEKWANTILNLLQ